MGNAEAAARGELGYDRVGGVRESSAGWRAVLHNVKLRDQRQLGD